MEPSAGMSPEPRHCARPCRPVRLMRPRKSAAPVRAQDFSPFHTSIPAECRPARLKPSPTTVCSIACACLLFCLVVSYCGLAYVPAHPSLALCPPQPFSIIKSSIECITTHLRNIPSFRKAGVLCILWHVEIYSPLDPQHLTVARPEDGGHTPPRPSRVMTA